MIRGSKTLPNRTLGVLVSASVALFIGASSQANAAPREVGIWFDDSGKGAVEILPCGNKLCGRIMWLKEPLNDQGTPKVDRYNPNPARRTTLICGLQVMGGLQAMPEGTWDAGWIYDPKTGSSYDVEIRLVQPDQLQVTGYKGVKLFSKSFLWRRAAADLPRCNDPAAEQQAETAPIPKTAVPKPKPAVKPAPVPADAGGETLPWNR